MASLLTLQDVRVTLGGTAIGPVTVRVEPGERIAILGPSGAGKSTLLRLIARELRPSAGLLHFDGRPLATWSPTDLARRRAVLPQQHGVAFGLPVELVVALGRVARQGDGQQDRIVREALAHAQAEHLHGRRFDTLSGGEQARVQLARVFAGSEFDFDIQLVLAAAEVPAAQLTQGEGAGPRLGWTVWLISGPPATDADEAVFDAEWVTSL